MPAFEPQFKPVVLPGENVEIIKSSAPDVLGYYRVKYIEQLPGVTYNFGTVSSESTSGDKEITNLYMKDGEFAQYRAYVLSDIEVTVKQPKAKTRFTGKNYTHKIDAFTHQRDPTLKETEMFVWEDEKVWLDAKNPTKRDLPLCRIVFFGFRFVVEKIAKPPKFTTIAIEGT